MIFIIFYQFCRMPLLTKREIEKRGEPGIWHITESLDVLLKKKKFTKNDLEALSSFSSEQRKKEWLVARILVEVMTGKKDIQIQYDERNKPSLIDSKKYISLSHSHDLLAVILDDSETGIDIELVKSKILRIKEKFMSKKELNSLQKGNEAEHLTVYWCAKESLYKLYGKKELAFKENLIIESFQYSEKESSRDG